MGGEGVWHLGSLENWDASTTPLKKFPNVSPKHTA